MIWRWLARALLMLLAVPAAAQGTGGDYHVGPGDVLKITVYRQPDLETTTGVSDRGTIQFGALGAVNVTGLTPGAIGDRIAERLKSGGILLEPIVTVLVTEYHNSTVSVLGVVAHPGEYPIDRSGLTITEMLARAGANFERGGALISVVAPPGSGKPPENFHAADLFSGGRDRPVARGEKIFVQAPAMVFVRGEVQRPGAYPIDPGMTVDQAIALAGGLTPRGSSSKVKVTRSDASGNPMPAKRARLTDPVTANDTLVIGARLF